MPPRRMKEFLVVSPILFHMFIYMMFSRRNAETKKKKKGGRKVEQAMDNVKKNKRRKGIAPEETSI